MRIFPLALIAIGVIGVLKHFGLIDPEFMRLFWPVLLIAIGVAMLVAGPRWRSRAHERMQDHWERRMHRRFGPGWSSLSEEERERFRAGMNGSTPAQRGAVPRATHHRPPPYPPLLRREDRQGPYPFRHRPPSP